MRRIIKHGNVTTSDGFFLLGDIPLEEAEADIDDEATADMDLSAEDDDIFSESTDSPSPKDAAGKKNASSRSGRQTAQEIAQLHELRDQIIAQATAESARLIQEGHALAQAEYHAAIKRAEQEIEKARQDAMRQGQKQAYEKHAKAISDCIVHLEDGIARMEGVQAGFITGYENDLKWMALEIAQKVLADAISADETQLVPLVMAAVNSVKNSSWISVEISENMTRLLTQLQQELKELPYAGKIGIKLVCAPDSTCMVETPDSCVDASPVRQIENLKGYFSAEQG